MLPRDYSLFGFSKAELPHFFKTAHRLVRHKALDILSRPKIFDYGRLLVVTPKRIGSAVHRNKIRRRLKHIFYEEKLFESGFDYIIVVKKSGLALSFDQLHQFFTQAVCKA